MIPSSRLVPTSLNKGRPVVLDEPTSEVSASIRHARREVHRVDRSPRSAGRPRRRVRSKKKFDLFSALARRRPRCRSQTDSPRPSSGTGSPRSGRGCRSAWSRSSARVCTTPRSPTPSSRVWSTSACASCSTRRSRPLSAQEKLLIVRQIGDSVLGLGPLEPFVRDPEVTEIMVNGWDTIYVERAGKLYWTGAKFHDEGAAPSHDRQDRRRRSAAAIDESSPYVRRAAARRLPRERDHPAARDRRAGAHDPEVRGRPVPGRRPRLVRDDDPAGRRSSWTPASGAASTSSCRAGPAPARRRP